MKEDLAYWLKEKQNHIFYGCVFIVGALILSFKMFYPKKQSTDFLMVEKAYTQWEQTGENLEELSTALKHHPEMEAKFGAFIADRFILQGNGDAAKAFAEGVFQRISNYIPKHTAYAQGSVLIAQGNLSQALEQTLQLKEDITKDSLLYGFALLRAASLSRALNEKEEELSALVDLEHFIQTKSADAQTLEHCFSNENASLQTYIHFRKTVVQN